jgi:hypothetical protein
MKVLIGIIIGLILATVGLSGLATVGDKAIESAKSQIKSLADKE